MNEPKDIPHGLYCYAIIDINKDSQYGFRIKTLPCKFYQHQIILCGHCLLTDLDVDDMTKICGYNDVLESDLIGE